MTYAISKNHHAFIVRAGTIEDLNRELDQIRSHYPKFAQRYLRPGYMIVEASTTKQAKQKAREKEHAGKIIYGELFRYPNNRNKTGHLSRAAAGP